MTTVTLDQVQAAIDRARTVSDDWQAECLEILMIPALAKRWQEQNPSMPHIVIRRHPGKPHKGMTPEDNRRVEDWSDYAGYVFDYGFPDCPGYGWNAVGKGTRRGFSHGPCSAWNGVRRETFCSFAEVLRAIAIGYEHPSHRDTLARFGIELADGAVREEVPV